MQPPVTIYALSTCGHCKATKMFLDQCNIQYGCTEVDLLSGDEREAIIEEVKKLNERCTFPTIIIGDKVIVGFNEQEIRLILGI